MIKSRRMRWTGYVACRMHIGYWWEMPERKKQLGRLGHRWVDNIKMDIREI
jgi:hypothetical protein